MATLDPMEAHRETVAAVADALKGVFPIKGRTHTLQLKTVEAADPKDPEDIEAQYETLVKGGSWMSPVHGTIELVENASGKVVKQQKMRLLDVPTFTKRLSYIYNGQEHQAASQWQLKPGVYARRQANGDLEARFNVVNRSAFKLKMEPSTGLFTMEYKKANIPALPILRAMGVKDEEMKAAWGEQIFAANAEGRRHQGALAQFYKTSTNGKAPPESEEELKAHLHEVMKQSVVRPEVTEMTMGHATPHVDGKLMLNAASKLIRVQNGAPEDNRDSLVFKTLRSTGDFIKDHIRDTGRNLAMKVQRQLNKGDVTDIRSSLRPGMFNEAVRKVFQSSLVNPAKQINPVDMLGSAMQTTIMGPGGIKSDVQVTDSAKQIDSSQFAMIDPLTTPEGGATGISLRLPIGVKRIGDQPHVPVWDVKQKKTVYVNPVQFMSKNVVLSDQVEYVNGHPRPLSANVKALAKDNEPAVIPFSKADYVLKDASQAYGISANLVPFIQNNSGGRVSMATRHIEQAIPLLDRDKPLVQVRTPGDSKAKTFEELVGRQSAHVSPVSGKVLEVTSSKIVLQDPKGRKHAVKLYNHYPLNDTKGMLHSTPLVKPGDTVNAGDVVADNNFTKDGVLALGKNLRAAFMSYHGNNYEDGIVITETAAKKLSSVHLSKETLAIPEINNTLIFDREKYKAAHPLSFTKEQFAPIGTDGVIKVGTKVKPGDPLIVAMQPFQIKDRTGIAALRKSLTNQLVDKSVRWNGEAEGEVVAIHRNDTGVHVHVRTVEPLKVGDKMCFDEKTEVLTSSGWKHVSELTLLDEICCLDPVTDEIRYETPTALHAYPTGGSMYRIQSQQVDLFVTLSHRMYAKKRRGDRFELLPASAVHGKRVRYKKDGIWEGVPAPDKVLPALTYSLGAKGLRTLPAKVIEARTYLMLLGMYLSEGSTFRRQGGNLSGISIAQTTPNGKEALVKALESAGIRFTSTPGGVVIHSRQLAEHFHAFGHAHEKFIPEEVFLYSKNDLEVLFYWLMWGDGYSKEGRPISYCTTSKRLADDVQRLCLHIGKAGNVKRQLPPPLHKNGKEYPRKPRYDVRIVNEKLEPEVNHGHTHQQKVQREELVQDYLAPVFCVTVPTHVLYVRRNGKACWSGNSHRYAGKGIVTMILPDAHAPRDKEGKPVEVLFQPGGLGGRMNIGQVLEATAGKIVQKTGQPFIVKNFDHKVPDWTAHMKQELAKHGISDTEELIDPKTGISYGQVLTGPIHFLKLVHQIDKKESMRGGMSLPQLQHNEKYDPTTLQPASGGHTGGQSWGQLGMYALLAHGAKGILREAMTFRSEGEDPETNEAKRWKSQHNEVWHAIQTGKPLPTPKPTFSFHRFTELIKGAGINVEKKGDTFYLSPMTDKHILGMSRGEITNPVAVVQSKRDETGMFKPIKGGTFDEAVTGGHGGIHWSHVRLAEPLPNPAFEEPIKKILGITETTFTDLLHGKSGVNRVTGKIEPYQAGHLVAGEGIKHLLKKVDIEAELKKTKAELATAKPSLAAPLYKKARYLQGLQETGLRPEDAYVLHHLPILPPKIRPLTGMDDGSLHYEGINGLYVKFGQINEALKEPTTRLLPPPQLATFRANLYDSVAAIFGTGTLPEGAKDKGVLHMIAGSSPKLGVFQKGLLSRRQDMSARATIIPEPKLKLDEIGVPKEMAMTIFRPQLVRQLVTQGAAKDELSAQKMLSDAHKGKEDPAVASALQNLTHNELVLAKRDPALWKYSIQAFKPVISHGKAIRIHPLVTGGFNADFDGDSVVGSVVVISPGSEHSVVDLKDFPRAELQRSTASCDEYSVPEDTFVLGTAGCTAKPYRVLNYSVHRGCKAFKVRLFSGEEIVCSSDHSLAVFDDHTLRVQQCTPRNAQGRFVPVQGRMDGHLYERVSWRGEELPATYETAERIEVTEEILRRAIVLPVPFRKGLLEKVLAEHLNFKAGVASLSSPGEAKAVAALLRSLGVWAQASDKSCKVDGPSLKELHLKLPRKVLCPELTMPVPFPMWIAEEVPPTLYPWDGTATLAWARKNRQALQEGSPSTYLARYLEQVAGGHLFWDRVMSATQLDEEMEMYDLTVEEAITFTLDSGHIVWDTMSLHVPMDEEAKRDAARMLPSKNIFSESTGTPTYLPSMESLLGIHRLSLTGKMTNHAFKDDKEAIQALGHKRIDLHDQVKVGGHLTTPGRILLSSAFPEPMQHKIRTDLSLELNKKGLSKVFDEVGRNHYNYYPVFADKMKDLGYDTSTGIISTPLHPTGKVGVGAHSFKLDDFLADKATRDPILHKADAEVAALQSKGLPKPELDRLTAEVYLRADKEIQKAHEQTGKMLTNNLGKMTRAGMKPSKDQYKQMTLAPMVMADSTGKLVPLPVRKSYGEGLDLMGYTIQQIGARSGVTKKVSEVQEPGYMTKLLQNVAMDKLIDTHDCGTHKGILASIHDHDLADRHLVNGLKLPGLEVPAGTLLSKDILDRIKKADPNAQLHVRSPLHCHSEKGICQKCYGLDANGRHPSIGTNVGVLSAHALGERAVQLTLKAFHCLHEHSLVLVRKSGAEVLHTTVRSLFESLPVGAEPLPGCEERAPAFLEIWDRGGWVRVSLVSRHPQQPGTQMVYARTRAGYGLLSQDNHPHMLAENTAVCPRCNAYPKKENDGRQWRCRWCRIPLTFEAPTDFYAVEPSELKDKSHAALLAEEPEVDPVTPPVPSGWFAGVFCAEGYIQAQSKNGSRYVVGFGISQNRGTAIYERIAQELGEAYGRYGCRPKGFQVYGREKALLLESTFGDASRNRGLPPGWSGYPQLWLDRFVAGVFDGDGTFVAQENSDRLTCRIDTTSYLLAQQLHHILRKRGVRARIQLTPWRKNSLHQGFAVTFPYTSRAKEVLSRSVKAREQVPVDRESEERFSNVVDYVRPVRFQAPPIVYDIQTETGTLFVSGVWTHNSGGVASAGGGALGAFGRLEQLTYLPDKIPNAATHATVHGKIEKIEALPTGTNIWVKGVPHFVGKDATGNPLHEKQESVFHTKPWEAPRAGMEVKPGQFLSDPNRTLLNPHRFYEATKSMDKVQETLAREMHSIYADEGVRKRAVEVVVRGMGNLTQVEHGGHSEFLRGQTYSRSAIEAKNKELAAQGKELIVHKPILRGVNVLPLDVTEDWMARLNHQKLRTTMMEGAAMAWKSDIHGRHPVPGLAYGAEFGKPSTDPKKKGKGTFYLGYASPMPRHPMVLPDTLISVPTEVIQVRVDRTYPDRFMVDVSSVHSRRFFPGVAVASPYVHYEGGAGFTATVKEGALGLLVVPSDGSPPTLLAFLAPYRPPQAQGAAGDPSKALPQDAQDQLKMASTNAPRFDGNRETGARGDILLLGTEGQGLRLLEGGVAEVGVRPLCTTSYEVGGHQRTFTRTKEDLWPGGLTQRSRQVVKGATHHVETWNHRLLEADAHASLRSQVGGSLLGEPDKQEINLSQPAAEAGVDLDEGVMELQLSPDQFNTATGEPMPKARNSSRFRALLTKAGSLCLRLLQSFVLRAAKMVHIEGIEGVTLRGKTVAIQGKDGVSIGSENGQVQIQGSVVKIAGGGRGVIAQGDIITFTIPPGTALIGTLTPPSPAGQLYTATFATPSLSISGVLTSPGSPSVKVP